MGINRGILYFPEVLMGAKLTWRTTGSSLAREELCSHTLVSALSSPCSTSTFVADPQEQKLLPQSPDTIVAMLGISWEGALGPLLQNQFFRDFWLGPMCKKWSLGWRPCPDSQRMLPVAEE